MDPYLESPAVWWGFHSRFINGISDALVTLVRPRYIVDVELRVIVQEVPDEILAAVRPDVTIAEGDMSASLTATSATATVAPAQVALPLLEEVRETYLEIRELETRRVVTVIEMLSPSNKQPGSAGWAEYVRKRNAVLNSPTHLVEIDLLRGGRRMPMRDPLSPGDYYVMVSRAPLRPTADVYAFGLRDPLPTISIPLAGNDPDAPLDLQTVLNTIYDRAGYDYRLDYTSQVDLPLRPEDAEWANALLVQRP
jgi:hypothetical protein